MSTLPEMERRGVHYLLAVAVLSDADDEERVPTGEIRSVLDVAPATVTEMVSKLDDRGLVDHEKYHGVTLTRHGDAIASDLAARVCVVSTYFESEFAAELDHRAAIDIAFTLPADGISTIREVTDSPCLDLCPEADGTAENRADR
ncbi:Mn-dependent transcriptional regulator, DtxR family [Halopenitus malekzadehii]|uniref:Mn-dependent transcriptional regulator, DtxR family n=2 Tax=Halopenitus malekzadehii TaxID=1267564 RepID=A0A1H6I678_9EURY|nr:Mn-dependent transcriptional regulator, DtxR family [Halopenitus malekzadehii]